MALKRLKGIDYVDRKMAVNLSDKEMTSQNLGLIPINGLKKVALENECQIF